jgi:hypothetical protein
VAALLVAVGEKFERNNVFNANSVRFQNFAFDVDLIDLSFKGSFFIWANKTNASKAIHVMLDRILASSSWSNMYHDASVNHLPWRHSDHCVILNLRGREIL